MTDARPDGPHSDASGFSLRAFLLREWPYLLVLILALFGVAYTSFSRTPMTVYWIVLAPIIGLICVFTRWHDAATRDQRTRLIVTQALHWVAVLLAMRLMFVADVRQMMNSDASALASLTLLALGTFTAGVHISIVAHLRGRRCFGDRSSGHRLARAVGAAAAAAAHHSGVADRAVPAARPMAKKNPGPDERRAPRRPISRRI